MARFPNFELVIARALTRLHKSTGSLIILVISTSPYGFIMIKKKMHGHCVEVLHVAHTGVCVPFS